jgi:hypothetical protein
MLAGFNLKIKVLDWWVVLFPTVGEIAALSEETHPLA